MFPALDVVHRSRPDLVILAIYIAIGIVFAFPLPFTMSQNLVGDDVDVWIFPWSN